MGKDRLSSRTPNGSDRNRVTERACRLKRVVGRARMAEAALRTTAGPVAGWRRGLRTAKARTTRTAVTSAAPAATGLLRGLLLRRRLDILLRLAPAEIAIAVIVAAAEVAVIVVSSKSIPVAVPAA